VAGAVLLLTLEQELGSKLSGGVKTPLGTRNETLALVKKFGGCVPA
jgi:hypothetical protein